MWGDGQYTADSDLATAVIHAGVLKNGETGRVGSPKRREIGQRHQGHAEEPGDVAAVEEQVAQRVAQHLGATGQGGLQRNMSAAEIVDQVVWGARQMATGQVAGGANMILFTTGRGSMFGAKPVPSVKLATNTPMYSRLTEDMDYNCGEILDGTKTMPETAEESPSRYGDRHAPWRARAELPARGRCGQRGSRGSSAPPPGRAERR